LITGIIWVISPIEDNLKIQIEDNELIFWDIIWIFL